MTCDGDICDCDCHDDGGPANPVREWAERQKMLGLITPDQFAVLERCIEDLEAP